MALEVDSRRDDRERPAGFTHRAWSRQRELDDSLDKERLRLISDVNTCKGCDSNFQTDDPNAEYCQRCSSYLDEALF